MKYSLLIACPEQELLASHLHAIFEVVQADESAPLIEQIRQTKPQLLIIGADALMNAEQGPFHEIKSDKIYHDIPIVAYYDGSDEQEKHFLYALGIKGILQRGDDPARYSAEINDVLSRSNPHVGSERDKFIKAFIKYEEAYGFISETLYLANYLIRYYRIDPSSASDIRLAVILLTVALKKRKIRKIMQLMQDLDFAPALITYLKSYHKPSNREEMIILAAMMIVEHEHKNSLLQAAYNALDPEIISVVNEAIRHHTIYIACTHDIFVFIMRLNRLLGESHGCLEEMDRFTKQVAEALSRILAKYGNVYALIEPDEGSYCITISLEDDAAQFSDDAQSLMGDSSEHMSVEFSENKQTMIACLRVDEMQPVPAGATARFDEGRAPSPQTEGKESRPRRCGEKRQVDISVINYMHYEEHQKISAKAFLEEFEYDSYLIDDLSESENDAKDVLYFKEDLTQPMLQSIINTFEHYTHLFNETIEFRDLAYSVNSLVTFLQSLDAETLEEGQKKTLKTYLGGIFENLANWKTHIFITQESPDIHYLDASLLNDCAQVESLFITAGSEEGDLEFF